MVQNFQAFDVAGEWRDFHSILATCHVSLSAWPHVGSVIRDDTIGAPTCLVSTLAMRIIQLGKFSLVCYAFCCCSPFWGPASSLLLQSGKSWTSSESRKLHSSLLEYQQCSRWSWKYGKAHQYLCIQLLQNYPEYNIWWGFIFWVYVNTFHFSFLLNLLISNTKDED